MSCQVSVGWFSAHSTVPLTRPTWRLLKPPGRPGEGVWPPGSAVTTVRNFFTLTHVEVDMTFSRGWTSDIDRD
jgi:hypothetical protein